MDSKLKRGSVLIDSYRRVRNEQYAARSRLRNARSTITAEEAQHLEGIIYFPYDEIIERIELEINLLCDDIPLFDSFVKKVPGLNIYDALQICTILKDVSKFENVSKLWSYCGFAPVQYCRRCGKRYFRDRDSANEWHIKHKLNKDRFVAIQFCTCDKPIPYTASERKVKGLTPDYNENAKKILVKIGDALIQTNGPYQERYLEYREKEFLKNSNLSQIHIENRAKRKVIKLFLFHLFEEWNKIEGNDKVDPYCDLEKFEDVIL